MSRVKTLALAVAVLFVLAGCAALFEFNLFGALDNPPTPTAADYEGADGLDQLDEDLDSPAVVDAMTPAVVAEIENNLWTDYLTDGVSGDEDGQAAILYADLALKTSEGENLVNNIVETILEGGITGSSTVADILADIIPPEALASEAVFTAMVNALLTANDAYLLLGDYVDGSTSDGVAENDLPPGSLPGDVAQKALVAYTMAVTVSEVMADLGIFEAEAINQLYLVATAGAYNPAMDTVTPDPYAAPDNGILALLDLAGVSIP
jgi:hypothetical protein